jgi:hypothetical protein
MDSQMADIPVMRKRGSWFALSEFLHPLLQASSLKGSAMEVRERLYASCIGLSRDRATRSGVQPQPPIHPCTRATICRMSRWIRVTADASAAHHTLAHVLHVERLRVITIGDEAEALPHVSNLRPV